MKSPTSANVTQLQEFDVVIDVRTPAEFADDHIPGAVNYPVLSNDERIVVGTMYKQISPFEAKKLGASYIAKKIAHYIENNFMDKPKDWKPLIYCWRGGKRSGSMTHIFRQIGWNAHILDGGYKSYRRSVIDQLNSLPSQFNFQIITGMTGSGKSKVLEKLHALGAQVLDLENLAQHKGSVLGNLPDAPQPSQKMFETLILTQLEKLDSQKIVFVEAESRKIGSLHVPDVLLNAMRQSPCVRIEATTDARVDFLIHDYPYFIDQPDNLIRTIGFLKELHGKETLEHWKNLILSQEWVQLVSELLEKHYDALYKRSQNSNYLHYEKAPCFTTADLSAKGIEILATQILAGHNHA
jgi:tRNA 2-selenouridine synthase